VPEFPSKRTCWGKPHWRIDPEPFTAFEQLLANPSATALNQNNEHYYEQYAGNNPDDRDIVHVDSPFFLNLEVLLKTFHHNDCRGAKSH